MRSVIRLRRRIAPGAIGPVANQIDIAEPVYTDPSTGGTGLGAGGRPVDFLTIGHGGLELPTILVGSTRQLELMGLQTVEVGATNAKTFDVTNFRLTGGGQANADLLSTDGLGNLGWVDLNDLGGLTGIVVSAPLTPTTGINVGTTANPLGLTMADATQITAGTNTVFPVSSAGLRGVTGDLTTLTTNVTARNTLVAAINDVVTTIGALDIGVTTNASLSGSGTSTAGDELRINPATAPEIAAATPDNIKAVSPAGLRGVTGDAATLGWATTPTLAVAINEIRDQVVLLQSGVQLVGTYNAPTNMVINPKAGTLTAGPLPNAAPNMTGWYLNVAGFGVTALPIAGTVGTPMAPGDRVECDGTQWTHTDMGMSAMSATGVAFTPIAAPNVITGTNVQTAIEQLNTAAMRLIHLDTTIFGGDGLTAATPLTIREIDGGEYI